MIEPPSSHPSIDHETRAQAMRELIDRIFRALDGATARDDCLVVLVDLLGAGGSQVVIALPDGTTDLAPAERDEICRTIVRQALETGRCVVYRPEQAAPGSAWKRLQADRARIDAREIEVIRAALTRNGAVVAHAARELGVARTTLSSRIDALGLRKRGSESA